MSRRRKTVLILLFLLLLLLLLLLWRHGRRAHNAPASAVQQNAPPIAAPVVSVAHPLMPARPPRPATKPVLPSVSKPTLPAKTVLPSTSTAVPAAVPVTPAPAIAPGEAGLHKELIPKNIVIERIYYEEPVVGPNTQFGFDINGSGFDAGFQQMISVDFDSLDVEATNMRLVTANQIHGTVNVGDAATTHYVSPQIMIHGLPVFRAAQPFGVVRPDEVLDIQLLNIDPSGQMGQFRVITNMDAATYKRLRILPTTPRLEVGDLTVKLPFYIDGVIRIQPGVSSGQYGLTTLLGAHELLKKDPLVDVVHPDVGRTGTVETMKADVGAHRPGDDLSIHIKGSGFTAGDTAGLSGKVTGFEMPPGQVTYISPGELSLHFLLPQNIPTGLYGADLLQKGRLLFERKVLFAVVPANWLNRVQLPQPLRPGQRGVVQLTGRDLSPPFIAGLTVSTDEPGLVVSPPRLQDASTAVFDIAASSDVASGDYIVHVSYGGKTLKLPGGGIIKVTQ